MTCFIFNLSIKGAYMNVPVIERNQEGCKLISFILRDSEHPEELLTKLIHFFQTSFVDPMVSPYPHIVAEQLMNDFYAIKINNSTVMALSITPKHSFPGQVTSQASLWMYDNVFVNKNFMYDAFYSFIRNLGYTINFGM